MPDSTRFTRRNYWIFILEGALFGIGIAFVSLDSVLPSIAHALGGSDSLVAFLPMAMMLGFFVPPLFTAHWLEKLGRQLPTLRVFCLLQRLPYLFAALALWFLATDYPRAALGAVALAPLLSGVFGGITVAAWFRLTSRMVPGRNRSSAIALRNLLVAVSGIGAGLAVERIFTRLPGPQGFALLHALAFTGLLLSYIVLCMSDEPDVKPPSHEHHKSLAQQLKSLPATLRNDRGFAAFALSRACYALVYVTIPFMAIHATVSTGTGLTLVGSLLAWQMGGSILGNLFGGWLGDHRGSRNVLMAAQAIALLMLLVFISSSQAAGYFIAFALWGMAASMQVIGEGTFISEHAFGSRMPTYISLSSLAALCGMLLSGTTSSLLRHLTHSMIPLVCISAMGVGTALFLNTTRTPEPRHKHRHNTPVV